MGIAYMLRHARNDENVVFKGIAHELHARYEP